MEYTKKVVVVGDVGVGKTSFVARVTEGRFISEHKTTIGVDCAVKPIRRGENTTVRLALWDIGGQETFRALMPQYARSSAGIVIICDVSSRLTVDGVRTWKMEADKVLVNGPPCILLVNKFDLPKHIHCVTTHELDELAVEYNLSGWYQTSVKENINLQVALEDLADLILQNEGTDSSTDPDILNLEGRLTLQRHYVEKRTCCD